MQNPRETNQRAMIEVMMMMMMIMGGGRERSVSGP